MKAVARIEHAQGAIIVTDETGATPHSEFQCRWGIDVTGAPLLIESLYVLDDDTGPHVLCLGAAMTGATVYDVDQVPTVVTPLVPGVGLARLVRAGRGGRAPPGLLHRMASVLVASATQAARWGVGTPWAWCGVDGAVLPRSTVAPSARYPTRRVSQASRFELACLAPELVRGEQDVDEATLAYALGVALHGLAFGVLPWRCDDDDNIIRVLQATLQGQREPVTPESDLEALIVACTARERQARPDLMTLAAAIDPGADRFDIRPTVAGLVGGAWQQALDLAEQLALVDGRDAPVFAARPFDLSPWQARLRHPLPRGVDVPIPLPGAPTRVPF